MLAAKQWTWLFVSGDSGDWLAASTIWIVPQPYGSPLYIILGHLVKLLPFGNLALRMTLFLSVIPAAITVTTIYLIILEITKKRDISFVCAIVMLASFVPLTQATVLEEYSIAVMFSVLAFYFYLLDKKWLVALSLGLGTAIHIVTLPVALFWLVLNARNIKLWIKVLPLYFISGILPYSLILLLMSSDAPPLIAEQGLSWQTLNNYIGSTSVVGALSIAEAPVRLFRLIALLLSSLGLAVIPVWRALHDKWNIKIAMLTCTASFAIWYYTTCLDPTTWTYLVWAIPFLVILCGIGLSRLPSFHTLIIWISALCLLAINGLCLNADVLSRAKPEAMEYYNQLMSLPDGSAVLTFHGGNEGLGFDYVFSTGKKLIPIYLRDGNMSKYQSYLNWIHDTSGIQGSSTRELVESALSQNIQVYLLQPDLFGWNKVFNNEPYSTRFVRVTSVNMSAEPITDTIGVVEWNPLKKLWQLIAGL